MAPGCADRRRDVLDGSAEPTGGEQNGKVRFRSNRIEHLAHHLSHRMGGERMLGDGGTEGHQPAGSAGGNRVKGTVVVGPRSMRTVASTVP